jgi:hypothetical protein
MPFCSVWVLFGFCLRAVAEQVASLHAGLCVFRRGLFAQTFGLRKKNHLIRNSEENLII